MAIKTKITDKGWNKIKRELKVLRKAYSAIGFFSGDGDIPEDELTMATLAAIHEFGTSDGHIPERSFMRAAIDQNRTKLHRVATGLYKQVLKGEINAKTAAKRLGVFGESLIKKYITDLKDPPNAPSTIRQKGSSNPLIDTGRMRNTVRHEEFFGKRPK